jgi:carotenoid 1,2-hydratase
VERVGFGGFEPRVFNAVDRSPASIDCPLEPPNVNGPALLPQTAAGAPAPLLTLAPPERELPRQLLDTPGGFAWWYLDLLEPGRSPEDAHGAVLIWSFGLPFLPGYTAAARQGTAPPAGARPSLNLVIYERGKPAFYALQEFSPGETEWVEEDGGVTRWRFGANVIERVRQGGEGGRVDLIAKLSLKIPGADSPLTGTISAGGPARRSPVTEGSALTALTARGLHEWSPILGPALGTVDCRQGQRTFQFQGRAYHDRNGGERALDQLGLDHWYWARVPLAAEGGRGPGELVVYLLNPEGPAAPQCLGVVTAADGASVLVDDLRAVVSAPWLDWAGMAYHRELTVLRGDTPWTRIRFRHLVDSGPFYLRALVTAETWARGVRETATGMGELCRPSMIDLDAIRPLVQMRVDTRSADNSIWLPLFAGTPEDRFDRLRAAWAEQAQLVREKAAQALPDLARTVVSRAALPTWAPARLALSRAVASPRPLARAVRARLLAPGSGDV